MTDLRSKIKDIKKLRKEGIWRWSNNTFIGYNVGSTILTGNNNISIGYAAGQINNIFIGYDPAK